MKQIFVSRPSAIEKAEEAAYAAFEARLTDGGLRARRLGQTDYSLKAPVHAVMDIMDQCNGAIILGYPQVVVRHEVRRGTSRQEGGVLFPTPWNQIEGALALRARIPVLVVANEGVGGGLFDYGVTGDFVVTVDLGKRKWFDDEKFKQVYEQWKQRIEA